MVAITTPRPTVRPGIGLALPGRRTLRLVPAVTAPVRSTPLPVRVFWGLLAAVALVAVAYLAFTPATTPGSVGAADPSAAHVVVAGETMWSIAQDVAPAGEAATYVERLVEANGGASVTPGQHLVIPAP